MTSSLRVGLLALCLTCMLSPTAHAQLASGQPDSLSVHPTYVSQGLIATVSNDISSGGLYLPEFWSTSDCVISSTVTPAPWGGSGRYVDDVGAGVTAPDVPHQTNACFNGWATSASYDTNNFLNPTGGTSMFRFQLGFDGSAGNVSFQGLYWENITTYVSLAPLIPANPFFQAHVWIDGVHHSAMNISLFDQVSNPAYTGASDLSSSETMEYNYFMAFLPAGFELTNADLRNKTLTVDLYASQATGGDMIFDDIALIGNAHPVPEPGGALLILAASIFTLRRARHR